MASNQPEPSRRPSHHTPMPQTDGIRDCICPEEKRSITRRSVTAPVLRDFYCDSCREAGANEDKKVSSEENEEARRKEEEEEKADLMTIGAEDMDSWIELEPRARFRALSSPAVMRSYIEKKVGRHLRLISDDFNDQVPETQAGSRDNLGDGNQSEEHDSDALSVADDPLVSPASRDRNGFWNRVATYLLPTRYRTRSESEVGDARTVSQPNRSLAENRFSDPRAEVRRLDETAGRSSRCPRTTDESLPIADARARSRLS